MTPYPFTAIVGLDELRLALLLNAVSPAIGGVLVRGEKGTAKSTVVRALAGLLPAVHVVAGCRFSCQPDAPDPACPDGPHAADAPATMRPARLVELPVGASEDRVTGALDLERALTAGQKAFEPGLLAAAHRGVLYVDEVNLLPDHLVDLLLDAAAFGTAYVEREGISVRHAARFLLVGTMNPEEGELRPQLLDRFGLTVAVAASRDPVQRADVVRRRLAYEADPTAFAASYDDCDAELAARIVAARDRLPRVVLPDVALRQVSAVCAAFDVDGMRADLVTAKAALALAAWHGRAEVSAEDVRQAALLALPHRRRRNPLDAPGMDEQALEDALDRAGAEEAPPAARADEPGSPDDVPDPPGGGVRPPRPEGADGAGDDAPAGGASPEANTPQEHSGGAGGVGGGSGEQAPAGIGPSFRARLLQVPGIGAGAAGRRSRAEGEQGRLTGYRRPNGRLGRLHLAATLRAAAPHQQARGGAPGILLAQGDLREAVREGREGNLVLFVVDASGSMAARQRMRAVKGAVLSLLLDAYQRRDKVGLVTFRGEGAELVLPPTSSVEVGAARLAALPTGGRTPLAAGLYRAGEVLRTERLRDSRRRALLVVVTDGRATYGGPDPVAAARAAARVLARGDLASVVVDAESGPVRLGLAAGLAADLRAPLLRLDELAAEALGGLVHDTRRAA